MRTQKLIRYRIGVSKQFPTTHPRRGEQTFFEEKINNVLMPITEDPILGKKMHTIRANEDGTAFERWEKRFEKINAGEAVLELFHWSGSPYNSKHDGSKPVVFATLTKDDGIGIQKLEFLQNDDGERSLEWPSINQDWHQSPRGQEVAKNDGLSFEDWKAWFKGYDLSEPMAIIHFTNFRY